MVYKENRKSLKEFQESEKWIVEKDWYKWRHFQESEQNQVIKKGEKVNRIIDAFKILKILRKQLW